MQYSLEFEDYIRNMHVTSLVLYHIRIWYNTKEQLYILLWISLIYLWDIFSRYIKQDDIIKKSNFIKLIYLIDFKYL